jgi:hypothetical protein
METFEQHLDAFDDELVGFEVLGGIGADAVGGG